MRERVILVPTDFSENSEAAVRFAVGLACDIQARIIVMHAYRLLQTLSTANQSPFSIKDQWDKTTKEKFEKLKKEILNDCELDYTFESDVGFAADTILSAVNANEVDLVIMGTSGEGSWEGVFGSTTLKIINKVNCPVIVIPPKASYSGLDQITFAYDFKEVKSFSKFSLLVEFIRRFNSHFEILNINNKAVISDEDQDDQLYHFDKYLNELNHTYSFISNESVPEGILDHISKKSTDLLVLLKRDHNLYQKVFTFSVTKKVVLNTELPLMVLRE